MRFTAQPRNPLVQYSYQLAIDPPKVAPWL